MCPWWLLLLQPEKAVGLTVTVYVGPGQLFYLQGLLPIAVGRSGLEVLCPGDQTGIPVKAFAGYPKKGLF